MFERIKDDYLAFAQRIDLNAKDIHFVPMSALKGDNVVNRSEQTPWYSGKPLMEILETVEIAADRNLDDLRFPVQYVNRPTSTSAASPEPWLRAWSPRAMPWWSCRRARAAASSPSSPTKAS